MPKGVVGLFKTIYIKKNDRQWVQVAGGEIEFTGGKLKKIAAVVQPGQTVGARQYLFICKHLLEFTLSGLQ